MSNLLTLSGSLHISLMINGLDFHPGASITSRLDSVGSAYIWRSPFQIARAEILSQDTRLPKDRRRKGGCRICLHY